MITIQDPKHKFHRRGGLEAKFEIANQDTTQTNLQYYGYLSGEGDWVIQCGTTTAGGGVVWSYAAGRSVTDYMSFWNANGIYTGGATFYRFDQLTAG